MRVWLLTNFVNSSIFIQVIFKQKYFDLISTELQVCQLQSQLKVEKNPTRYNSMQISA